MSRDPIVRALLGVIAFCLAVLVAQGFLPRQRADTAGAARAREAAATGAVAATPSAVARYELEVIRSPDEGVFLLRTDSSTGRTWHKSISRKERFWIPVEEATGELPDPDPKAARAGRYVVKQGRSIYGPVLLRLDTLTGEVQQKHMSVASARWERIREPGERRSPRSEATPKAEAPASGAPDGAH